MFRSNVSSKFLYFVGKVLDENTGKISTRVNGWQYVAWLNCLVINENLSSSINVFVNFACMFATRFVAFGLIICNCIPD